MFLGSMTPPNRLVRGVGLREVVYGLEDASGTGFGLSWDRMKEGSRVDFRVGV